MPTLIAVYNSEGCVGRCDARCYEAIYEKCECICKGSNHSKGLKQAAENTEEQAKDWIKTYKKELVKNITFKIPEVQMNLL